MKVPRYLLLFSALSLGYAEDNLLDGYDGSYEIVWMKIDREPGIPGDKNRVDDDADEDLTQDEDALMVLSCFSP